MDYWSTVLVSAWHLIRSYSCKADVQLDERNIKQVVCIDVTV